MTSRESVRRLAEPVIQWLTHGGDAWQMGLAYWELRRDLMDHGESFEGPPSEILSNMDTAIDSFDPDPTPYQIDEKQLRTELTEAIRSLRAAGYLDES